MRSNLLKLLRQLEKESGYRNQYTEFEPSIFCDYQIEEYLDFPNYRFITSRYNDEHAAMNGGIVRVVPSNSILAELKRMEVDGLLMIGVQDARKYATALENRGPDFNEGDGIAFSTESVVLTTQGKSWWYFLLHSISANPIANAFSLIAVIVSVIALFIGP